MLTNCSGKNINVPFFQKIGTNKQTKQMIPFLLAAAGGYLIAQSRKQDTFADGGITATGYAKGGTIKSYKDFKAQLIELAKEEGDRDAFAQKVKSEPLKKYVPLYFSDTRRDILNVTDNQYRIYMTKPNQYVKELNSINWESVYDKLKGKMASGGKVTYDDKIEFLKYILKNTSKFSSSIKELPTKRQDEIKESISKAKEFAEGDKDKKNFNEVAGTLYKNLFLVNTNTWSKITRKYYLDNDIDVLYLMPNN
jgi:hypothetical protein